jgi:2-polyprenyl-3-methyl-5-hydroxy-6-metoxy-1,4-benzoquinol methylase
MNTHSQDATLPQEGAPWLEPWPTDQLEALRKCPICGNSSREILHADLVDNTFFCAPGIWKMWSCKTCSAAYLDPRPTPLSIGLAYKSYYTHAPNSVSRKDFGQLSVFRKFRRMLVNGYTNWRFGTHEREASGLGIALIGLIPSFCGRLANEYRNIPRVRPKNAVALDLGCGDGSFLALANRCGWHVVGADPDEMAVEAARKRGFDIHLGGVEVFEGQEARFDLITMNHVIEHLHDPVDDLAACYRLLKPGGRIWIETPNIQSYGHKSFGTNWRGLEAPRHLVLFSRKTLYRALSRAGFDAIRQMPDRNVYRHMYTKSHAMRSSERPDTKTELPLPLDLMARLARLSGATAPKRREFLTLTAEKE